MMKFAIFLLCIVICHQSGVNANSDKELMEKFNVQILTPLVKIINGIEGVNVGGTVLGELGRTVFTLRKHLHDPSKFIETLKDDVKTFGKMINDLLYEKGQAEAGVIVRQVQNEYAAKYPFTGFSPYRTVKNFSTRALEPNVAEKDMMKEIKIELKKEILKLEQMVSDLFKMIYKYHFKNAMANQMAKCGAMIKLLNENAEDNLELAISMFLVDLMGYSVGLKEIAIVVDEQILSGNWKIDFANAVFGKKEQQ